MFVASQAFECPRLLTLLALLSVPAPIPPDRAPKSKPSVSGDRNLHNLLSCNSRTVVSSQTHREGTNCLGD